MATGKYARVINKLPRYLGEDPGYRQKVNAVMHEIMQPGTEEDPPPATWDEIVPLLQAIEVAFAQVNNLLLRAADGQHRVSTLARVWRWMRAVKDTFEAQEKETNLLLEAYKQLLIDHAENEDVSSVRLTTGELIGVQWEPHAVVVDRDKLREWVKIVGLERELQLPWQTLNALTKERLLKGELEPDGVEAKANAKLVLRKS
jgi:hypothetical protein